MGSVQSLYPQRGTQCAHTALCLVQLPAILNFKQVNSYMFFFFSGSDPDLLTFELPPSKLTAN
jgi:hypothetical protein